MYLTFCHILCCPVGLFYKASTAEKQWYHFLSILLFSIMDNYQIQCIFTCPKPTITYLTFIKSQVIISQDGPSRLRPPLVCILIGVPLEFLLLKYSEKPSFPRPSPAGCHVGPSKACYGCNNSCKFMTPSCSRPYRQWSYVTWLMQEASFDGVVAGRSCHHRGEGSYLINLVHSVFVVLTHLYSVQVNCFGDGVVKDLSKRLWGSVCL